MARRAALLQTTVVAAVLVVACGAVLLVVSQKAEAAFPGQNGRITFYADGSSDDLYATDQIFTINPDGTGEKQLTHNRDVYNITPVFSPNGKKIAWVRNGNGDVWIMNANGTNKERLTSGPAEDFAPAFSPDGRRVAFVRIQAGRYDIYIKALDGGGLRRVTNDRNYEGGPVFSPGGGRIAFSFSKATSACNVCAVSGELATVHPDGTGLRVITHNDNDHQPGAPDWSPDGRTLVFSLYDFSAETGRIETIRADGTRQRTVFAPKRLSADGPVFSPDGTKIAFDYEDGSDIWTINTDGSGLSDVTKTPFSERKEFTPDWQPKLQPTG